MKLAADKPAITPKKYLLTNNKISFTNNPRGNGVRILCKSRAIDPLCYYNGQVKHLSAIDRHWIDILRQELQPKEYSIEFER